VRATQVRGAAKAVLVLIVRVKRVGRRVACKLTVRGKAATMEVPMR